VSQLLQDARPKRQPSAARKHWRAINLALYNGHRGLAGGSSLAKFLKQGCQKSRWQG
jgi:hypothetical protein